MQDSYRHDSITQGKTNSPKAPKSYLASLGSVSDWLNLFFLLVCLGIVVFTAQQARWLDPSPSLLMILLISVLTGFFTARSRWPVILSLALAGIIGAAVIFWQCLLITPGMDLDSRLLHMGTNLRLFWDALNLGLPIPVTIHVAIVFGALSWLIGYFSSWFLIRKNNPWPAIFLGTVMLLVILNFWLGKHYLYFLVFLAAALILLVRINYARNLSLVYINEHVKFTRVPKLWLGIALVVAAVALSFSWINPGFAIKPVAEFASVNNPYRSTIDHAWQNFFAQIPGSGAPRLTHGAQTDLIFGGSLTISDQVYFIIESERQNYWKTQIFDYYDSTGWKTNPTTDTTIEPSSTQSETPAASGRLEYTVIPQINTDVLPTTGEFISADGQAVVKKLTPLTFQIDLFDSSKDSLLPGDIASLSQSIRTARINNRRMTDAQLTTLIPTGLNLINLERSGIRVQSLKVSRKTQDDTIVALSASKAQAPQQQFSIAVKMPDVVQAQDLAQAGVIYPKEITDRYLQLPSTLPSRVKELAKSVTQASNTPYEKAIALKKYLSQYPYTLTIETPAQDVDGVDFFLFTQESGYCTYFASAMTVMLRSAGVPARLVTGFLTGQYIPDVQRSVLRDRDYHAWTEIYFPKYGWITLDSTPGIVSTEADSGSPDVFPTSQAADLTEESILPGEPVPAIPTSAPSENGINLFIFIGPALIAGLLFLFWLFSRKTRYGPNLYSPMIFLSSLGGSGPKPWQTPLEFSEQLSAALPKQASIIHRIISHYVIVSYGGEKTLSQKDVDRRSWSELKKALIKRIIRK